MHGDGGVHEGVQGDEEMHGGGMQGDDAKDGGIHDDEEVQRWGQ